MIRQETKLVLGRGEVYFEPFAPGTRVGDGERYLGNTPSFQLGRSLEALERFRSYAGQKVKQERRVITESNSIQFVTDNIDFDNIALWYGQGTAATETKAGYTTTEQMTLRKDRSYQLGRSQTPVGVRYVEGVTLRIGGTLVPMANNWELDRPAGRIYVLPDAVAVPNGALGVVEFQWRSVKGGNLSSKARDVFGALRFMATNPTGPLNHYFFPFVRITPRGQFDLKGDQFQQILFEAETMRLNPASDQVYVDQVISVGGTYDEETITNIGQTTLAAFPALENLLDITVNTSWPAANIGQAITLPGGEPEPVANTVLATGRWRDTALWSDAARWKDQP